MNKQQKQNNEWTQNGTIKRNNNHKNGETRTNKLTNKMKTLKMKTKTQQQKTNKIHETL